MSDVKQIPEVYPASRFIKGNLLGRLPFDSSFLPIFPKNHVLRAGHEALNQPIE